MFNYVVVRSTQLMLKIFEDDSIQIKDADKMQSHCSICYRIAKGLMRNFPFYKFSPFVVHSWVMWKAIDKQKQGIVLAIINHNILNYNLQHR